MFAEAFADIASSVSVAFGGPFWAAQVVTQTDVEYDAGGSIVDSGEPQLRACSAQVDVATEAMRQAANYVEEDRRIIVLAASLVGDIGTDDQIELLAGPFQGLWAIQSVTRDPASVCFELRARPAQ